MDIFKKLQLNSENTHVEIESERECIVTKHQIPVTEAYLPNGKKIKMLKSMLTSACENDCYYCAFRSGRDVRRATFKPDDFANIFMQIYQKGLVEGLFLSSGVVNGGIVSQDKLIATSEILRKKYNYRGYIHLKIMPGVEYEQLLESMKYASRISINLEAPNDHRLSLLAPRKRFYEELMIPIRWANKIRKEKSPYKTWNNRWPSSATQFVIGAVGESDLELISTSEKLLNQFGLRRVYYSRFTPIPNTPLENNEPEDPIRKNRLYQASYLIRDYNFNLEEMPFDQRGLLPKGIDPKLAWAKQNLLHNPIEINKADREQLLKIPGIGPKSADQIMNLRKFNRIRDSKQLQKVGINTKRAAEFIIINGQQPTYQPLLL